MSATHKCSMCGKRRKAKSFGWFVQKSGKKQRRGRCNSCRQRLHSYTRYGVTEEWYKNKIIEQGNRCAICKKSEKCKPSAGNKKIRALSIDHCHKTERVRGLLCNDCNVMIGRAKDNVAILMNAVNYLEQEW